LRIDSLVVHRGDILVRARFFSNRSPPLDETRIRVRRILFGVRLTVHGRTGRVDDIAPPPCWQQRERLIFEVRCGEIP
jgi:hypothetical protein